MICQSRGCTEKARWQEVDEYTQPGQSQKSTYFYYFCDEHKEKYDQPTIGHKRKYKRLFA